MHDRLEIFRLAGARASHAAARQALVSQNVAHADTPGYRALDLPPFAARFDQQHGLPLERTRAGHLDADRSMSPRAAATASLMSPNGNAVSLEAEMVKAAEIQQAHSLALSVYESALGVLRTSLGRSR